MQGYGQPNGTMEVETKTAMSELYKHVRYFDQRINYHAQVAIGGCNYEVLINDYPVDRYFGPANGTVSGSVPINTAILKPGVQTWKIRIYPVRDPVEKDGQVTLVPQSSISEGARASMTIEGIRFKENGDIEKRFGEVLAFEAPLKKDDETGASLFGDAGKPFVEYSGTFEADVPYELTGWENSGDLTAEDSLALKQELLAAYQQFHGWLQAGDLENIAMAKLGAEKEKAQALFYDKNTNDHFLANFTGRWGQPGLDMQPLKDPQLRLYGNGKLATLIDVVDNGSPLWGNYQLDNGNYRHNTYLLYFHRPKGKDKLEVIR